MQTNDNVFAPRQAALVAGLGLLAMALLAPYAEVYVFPRLLVPDDTQASLSNLVTHRRLYLSGLAAVFANYVADIVVAWALYFFFLPVSRALALLSALFRLLYAGLGMAALNNLLVVARLPDLPGYAPALVAGNLDIQVQILLDSYRVEWGLGLMLFGLHLVLVGYLAWRSSYVPRLLGCLIACAGLGYILFNVGRYVWPDGIYTWLATTFLLEPVFMIWLLWKGRQITAGRISEGQALPSHV